MSFSVRDVPAYRAKQESTRRKVADDLTRTGAEEGLSVLEPRDVWGKPYRVPCARRSLRAAMDEHCDAEENATGSDSGKEELPRHEGKRSVVSFRKGVVRDRAPECMASTR